MWIEGIVVKLLNRLATEPRRPSSGLLLGHARDDHGSARAVQMPDARRCEHMVIVGRTGTGKTHFLQHLALQHMLRSEGFVFFDFHGDATHCLLTLSAGVPHADNRLVVIDPTDNETSPGLNPLEVSRPESSHVFGRASELSAILRARWNVEAFGARTEELLRNTLYALACHGLTLVDAPRFLSSTTWRRDLAARLPSAEIRSYWQDRFEPLSEAMKATFREPLLNKITGFLTEPAARHVLGQARSTVRFADHMAAGHWVLVNLAKGRLREHAQTLGNLIFAKLQFDVLARGDLPIARRRLCSILCDEVQNLAENDLATLLTEGRKFGVALVTANQFWEQLPRALRGALLATGTQAFFRVSAADARVLAAELGPSGAKRYGALLTELPRGQAVARIGGAAPEVITVPALPASSPTSIARSRDLRALSVARYARPRPEIEAEIDARREQPPTRESMREDDRHVRDDEGQREW